MPNTQIDYQYRDGGNYKVAGTWIVTGPADHAQVAAICKTLDGDGFFVPSAVGVPTLVDTSKWDGEIDHPYHSIERLAPTDKAADDPRTVAELAAAFAKADWEAAAATTVMEAA